MSDQRPLNRSYLSILASFFEAGGSGSLDHHARVMVGAAKHPLAGDASTWMALVARGYVAGEDGRIMLTDAGRAAAEAVIAGRTREAVQ